jgi:hypothetical protein
MRDRMGRELSRADRAEIERVNDENREAARRAAERKGKR